LEQEFGGKVAEAAVALKAGAADLAAAAAALQAGLPNILSPRSVQARREAESPSSSGVGMGQPRTPPQKSYAPRSGEKAVTFESSPGSALGASGATTDRSSSIDLGPGANLESKLLDESRWSPEPDECAEHDVTEIASTMERAKHDIDQLDAGAQISRGLMVSGIKNQGAFHTVLLEKQNEIDTALRRARNNRNAEKEMKELHVGWFKDVPERDPSQSKPASPDEPGAFGVRSEKAVNPASVHRELMDAHTERGLLDLGPIKAKNDPKAKGLSPAGPGV